MGPLTLAAIFGGAGLLGKIFNRPSDSGAGDLSQYYRGDFINQGINQGNDIVDKGMQTEMNNRFKMASNMIPGVASYRANIASQGVTGQVSNVIGNQQRSQMQGRALDWAGTATDTSKYTAMKMQNLQSFNQMGTQAAVPYFQAHQQIANQGYQDFNELFNESLNLGGGLLGQYFANQKAPGSGTNVIGWEEFSPKTPTPGSVPESMRGNFGDLYGSSRNGGGENQSLSNFGKMPNLQRLVMSNRFKMMFGGN